MIQIANILRFFFFFFYFGYILFSGLQLVSNTHPPTPPPTPPQYQSSLFVFARLAGGNLKAASQVFRHDPTRPEGSCVQDGCTFCACVAA